MEPLAPRSTSRLGLFWMEIHTQAPSTADRRERLPDCPTSGNLPIARHVPLPDEHVDRAAGSRGQDGGDVEAQSGISIATGSPAAAEKQERNRRFVASSRVIGSRAGRLLFTGHAKRSNDGSTRLLDLPDHIPTKSADALFSHSASPEAP
jgi:hypothetical protein